MAYPHAQCTHTHWRGAARGIMQCVVLVLMYSCSALQPCTQALGRRMRKSAWYTLFGHALNNQIHMCSGDVINSPCWCACWDSVQVSSISHCFMPSGGWLPQDKAQERAGCLCWMHFLRKHTFMQFNILGKSIPTTAYKTFSLVSDSIN